MIDRYEFVKGELDSEGLEKIRRLRLKPVKIAMLSSHFRYNCVVDLSNDVSTEEYVETHGKSMVIPVFNVDSFREDLLEFIALREGNSRRNPVSHGEFHRRRHLKISPDFNLMVMSPVFPYFPDRSDEDLFGEDGPLLQLANFNAVSEVVWRRLNYQKNLPAVDPVGFMTSGGGQLLYILQERYMNLKQYPEAERNRLNDELNRELESKGYRLAEGYRLKGKVVEEHEGVRRVLLTGFPHFVKK